MLNRPFNTYPFLRKLHIRSRHVPCFVHSFYAEAIRIWCRVVAADPWGQSHNIQGKGETHHFFRWGLRIGASPSESASPQEYLEWRRGSDQKWDLSSIRQENSRSCVDSSPLFDEDGSSTRLFCNK